MPVARTDVPAFADKAESREGVCLGVFPLGAAGEKLDCGAGACV